MYNQKDLLTSRVINTLLQQAIDLAGTPNKRGNIDNLERLIKETLGSVGETSWRKSGTPKPIADVLKEVTIIFRDQLFTARLRVESYTSPLDDFLILVGAPPPHFAQWNSDWELVVIPKLKRLKDKHKI